MGETRDELAELRRLRPDIELDPASVATWSRALDEAAAAWPSIELANTVFSGHLARRLPVELDIVSGLDALNVRDIFLAAALDEKVAGAERAFAEIAGGVFEQAKRAVRGSGAIADELESRVLVRVLGPRERDGESLEPAIQGFAGRCSLSSWLRVIAVREAVKLVRAAKREPLVSDDALFAALSPDASPELHYMKAVYREQVREAFAEALATITPKQRLLFRQAIIDELSLEQMAPLHQVGKSTVGRWLTKARAELAAATRAELASRLEIPKEQVDSILALVRSQLDITLGPIRG